MAAERPAPAAAQQVKDAAERLQECVHAWSSRGPGRDREARLAAGQALARITELERVLRRLQRALTAEIREADAAAVKAARRG